MQTTTDKKKNQLPGTLESFFSYKKNNIWNAMRLKKK